MEAGLVGVRGGGQPAADIKELPDAAARGAPGHL